MAIKWSAQVCCSRIYYTESYVHPHPHTHTDKGVKVYQCLPAWYPTFHKVINDQEKP